MILHGWNVGWFVAVNRMMCSWCFYHMSRMFIMVHDVVTGCSPTGCGAVVVVNLQLGLQTNTLTYVRQLGQLLMNGGQSWLSVYGW